MSRNLYSCQVRWKWAVKTRYCWGRCLLSVYMYTCMCIWAGKRKETYVKDVLVLRSSRCAVVHWTRCQLIYGNWRWDNLEEKDLLLLSHEGDIRNEMDNDFGCVYATMLLYLISTWHVSDEFVKRRMQMSSIELKSAELALWMFRCDVDSDEIQRKSTAIHIDMCMDHHKGDKWIYFDMMLCICVRMQLVGMIIA